MALWMWSGLAAHAAEPARVPVLVELFTSEGCSSCPPAEDFMARVLQSQPFEHIQVVLLALHVTYWDSIGWVDPYSNAAFTERQDGYPFNRAQQTVYTPQIVVDGMTGFVPELDRLGQAARTAARLPQPRLEVRLEPSTAGRISGAVRVFQVPPGRWELYVALVEDGVVQAVLTGENHGRTLRHESVARLLQRVQAWSEGNGGPVEFQLPALRSGKLSVVAFLQEAGQGRVAGVVRIPL